MGILEVNQIKDRLHENYDHLLDLSDIPSQKAAELEKNFLSRALAAYSVSILYPQIEKEDAVKYIVDGSEDNGIDLIFYNKDTNELCLTQSKFNGKGDSEPDLGEIKKFSSGVRDLINLRFDKFNKKVNDIKEEIIDVMKMSKLKFRVTLIYTATNLSAHARQEFNELLEELNDIREVAELEIINQKRIHSSLNNMGTLRNIDVEVQLKQWGHYEGGKEAFYGQITADQLAEWWENYGNNLYEYNLRKLLGTTDINTEMKETLETEPELFWYYNNGITLVCEEVDKKRVYGNKRDLGIFECKGISIVNGAQTVGVIGKFGQSSETNKEILKDVSIPFRIISMQTFDDENNKYLDENFASDVTTKNNRQNKIENRDFVVLDPVQKAIENTLAIDGITYHLMRAEEDDIISEDSLNLKEATRALSFAKDIEATILVSREIGLIYSDLNHNRYKKLFNESVTGYYVWNCVLLQRMIEKAITVVIEEVEDSSKAILIHGQELISKVLFDLIGIDQINKYKIGVEQISLSHDLEGMIRKILTSVPPSVFSDKKSLANTFKSPNDVRGIYSTILSSLASSEKVELQPTRGTGFDISQIDSLSRVERVALTKFNNKIKDDDILAKEFFENWTTKIYDPERHTFTYSSNIQFYLADDDKQATERFLFRIAYYTKLIVSFEFNVYGSLYKSVLFENPEFSDWAKNNTDTKERIIVNNEEDISKVLQMAQKFISESQEIVTK